MRLCRAGASRARGMSSTTAAGRGLATIPGGSWAKRAVPDTRRKRIERSFVIVFMGGLLDLRPQEAIAMPVY